jgi:hypothetical protein
VSNYGQREGRVDMLMLMDVDVAVAVAVDVDIDLDVDIGDGVIVVHTPRCLQFIPKQLCAAQRIKQAIRRDVRKPVSVGMVFLDLYVQLNGLCVPDLKGSVSPRQCDWHCDS